MQVIERVKQFLQGIFDRMGEPRAIRLPRAWFAPQAFVERMNAVKPKAIFVTVKPCWMDSFVYRFYFDDGDVRLETSAYAVAGAPLTDRRLVRLLDHALRFGAYLREHPDSQSGPADYAVVNPAQWFV